MAVAPSVIYATSLVSFLLLVAAYITPTWSKKVNENGSSIYDGLWIICSASKLNPFNCDVIGLQVASVWLQVNRVLIAIALICLLAGGIAAFYCKQKTTFTCCLLAAVLTIGALMIFVFGIFDGSFQIFVSFYMASSSILFSCIAAFCACNCFGLLK